MYRIHFANILHEQTLYIMHYANIVYQQCIDSKHMNMQTVLPLDCQVQGNCFNRVESLGASRDEDSLSLNWNYKLNGLILWVSNGWLRYPTTHPEPKNILRWGRDHLNWP